MTLIAKNIRWFRKQQQISQTEFASIFGITRASVGAYEEGRAEPKLELISRFAKYYNVDLSAFIDLDMSLSNADFGRNKSNNVSIETSAVNKSESPSKTRFVQEILEKTVSSSENVPKFLEKENILKASEADRKIIFYKSAKEYSLQDKSQWPFFAGCDAVFECNPHLEREVNGFRDGLFLLCVKITQDGLYNGVFIEQDRNRLKLFEGDINYLESEKTLWRVLYTIDSINSMLEK